MKPTHSRAGFTLIEIMVVLALIGAVLAAVAPRLLDKNMEIRKMVREIASSIRDIHNNARLFNSTYRLVLKYDEKEGDLITIESAPGNVTIMSEEQEEELDKLVSFDKRREEAAKRGGFSADARVKFGNGQSELRFPKGLYLGEIEYANREDPISEGEAKIHFFPQGLVEEVAIHLTDKKSLNWTIAIHPITGHADLYEGNIPLKELRAK